MTNLDAVLPLDTNGAVGLNHYLQRVSFSSAIRTPTTYNRSQPSGRALEAMSLHDWIESRTITPAGRRPTRCPSVNPTGT